MTLTENKESPEDFSNKIHPDSTFKRGFASMSPEKRREIAIKGGKASHEKGTSHKWNNEEARKAGRKGGRNSHRNKKAS